MSTTSSTTSTTSSTTSSTSSSTTTTTGIWDVLPTSTFDVLVPIENLAVGVGIAGRIIYSPNANPSDLVGLKLITQGTPAGIDDANTCVLTLQDSDGNTVLTKTFDTANQPPTSGVVDLGSLIVAAYAEIETDEYLTLTIVQGATSNLPACVLSLGFSCEITTPMNYAYEIELLQSRADALEVTTADHEVRLGLLETEKTRIVNVYGDSTMAQVGGSKNVMYETSKGGVYP